MNNRTPSSTESLRASAVDATLSSAPSSSPGQVTPYAQPQSPLAPGALDAVLIDAIRAASGPYVAAPWRAPHSAASAAEITRAFAATPSPVVPAVEVSVESTELPWIDAYLDASVETPVQWETDHVDATSNASTDAINDAATTESVLNVSVNASTDASGDRLYQSPRDASHETSHETSLEPQATVSPAIDASSSATTDDAPDAWPLAEAGEAMRELADQLSAHDVPQHDAPVVNADHENSLEPLFAIDAPTPLVKPLPMWSDDDMMDIMPVTHRAPAEEGDTHWAARARREAQRDARASDDIESAARVLEALAKRVRDGDLQINGYSPDMSEAAAVAAALASLLNARQ